MELPKAHYKLSEVKDLINQGNFIITRNAKEKAKEDFEYLEVDIVDAILDLTMANFYKSMTVRGNSKLWQDVYKTNIGNKKAYIKVQINEDCGIIISFKEDQS